VTVLGTPTRRAAAEVAAGDVDADGIDDLVALSSNSTDVTFFYGILYGRAAWPATIDLAAAPWDTEIPDILPNLGMSVDRHIGIVDLDADGVADLLVGNPGATRKGVDTGEILVWRGRRARLPAVLDRAAVPPDIVIEGPHAEAATGTFFTVGDINGDGRLDLVTLTQIPPQAPSGEVTVVLGPATWPRRVDLFDAELKIRGDTVLSGWGLQCADFDGDGFDDIAGADWQGTGPGKRSEAGRVFVWFGDMAPSGNYLFTTYQRSLALWGADKLDWLGRPPSPLVFRDVDGDGLADLLAPSGTATGPGNKHWPDRVGEILVVKGCRDCCEIWRNDAIRGISPVDPPKGSVLPLGPLDCYRLRHAPGQADPEVDVLADAMRPLVFYSAPSMGNRLKLVKSNGLLVIVDY
jgi:hypothetical protein